jgi:very-short-patch-repair endonuclease
MEKKVLDWLKATRLFQTRGHSLELIAQFPIGEYLRQLDVKYTHPNWKVDFLLRVPVKSGRLVQVIIEYDGFEFHFTDRASVHGGNFERYMTADDVERQKTLESYGYKFLRINRFNVGRDPVETLSNRLEQLVDLASVDVNTKSADIASKDLEDLRSSSRCTCPKCNQARQLGLFFDPALAGGTGALGRHCVLCKQLSPRAVGTDAG